MVRRHVISAREVKRVLITSSRLFTSGPILFNLSYDGGGGLKVPPSIFICENNRKSKSMLCVEKKNLSGGFEDQAIFHVIQ